MGYNTTVVVLNEARVISKGLGYHYRQDDEMLVSNLALDHGLKPRPNK